MIDNAHEPGTAGTNKSEEGTYQGPAAEDEAYRAACAAAHQLGEALIDEAVERYGRLQLGDSFGSIWDDADLERLLGLVARDWRGQTLDSLIRSIMAEKGLPVPDDHGWALSPRSQESNIFLACLEAACFRLASIREASIMAVSEAIADTARYFRYERAYARTTTLYADVGDCHDAAGQERLRSFDSNDDTMPLQWLEQLGLIVTRDGRSVYPSTPSERDEARENLLAAMRDRAYARASGYWHPIYGWTEPRTPELSLDDERELARIAAEISAEAG